MQSLRSALVTSLLVAALAQMPSPLTPDVCAALDHISPDSMRGHLSFIASDVLEGRNSPSRGLDLAAEYIAAQFRRAGLEPVGDDGYFQTANLVVAERGVDLHLIFGTQEVTATSSQVTLNFTENLTLAPATVVKVDFKDVSSLDALTPAQVTGRIVMTELPDLARMEPAQLQEAVRAQNGFLAKVDALRAALLVSLDRSRSTGGAATQSRLIDPENRPSAPAVLGLRLYSAAAANIYDSLKPGVNDATIEIRVSTLKETPVRLRNVEGLLPGSDPALKETYVVVTAHYDHLGMREATAGDGIYNGANDDGSGTVSVIEIASALAALRERPKRSVLFITFFGEERGLLGSGHYARHPIFPIEKTVANINLEQLGRTDSTEGPQIANATITGFDYSDLGPIFVTAGDLTGIKVYKHELNSDAYFAKSDNLSFANQGVPAHTLGVAFSYSDYHGLGDHWEKVDYANMARVDRMVALGVVMIANNPQEPRWNEANSRTANYVTAWKKRRGE